MMAHRVEVDEEVFEFVKSQAEPLVDDFNSALRRLLSIGRVVRGTPDSKGSSDFGGSTIDLPEIPKHTPVALQHILEVASLVRGGAYDRKSATNFVAKRHSVYPQTILDKYCRQLGLTANQFDHLLEEEKLSELRELLVAKFPGSEAVIDATLKC